MFKLLYKHHTGSCVKKRILFLSLKQWDLFSPLPYNNKIACNLGNFVFFSAGVSYFYSPELDVTFITQDDLARELQDNEAWVKDNFDLCIHMEANMLSPAFNTRMLEKSILFRKMQIPVFILGIGAQSSIDYSTQFISIIRENAKQYLDSIFTSGGNISVRGYFTQHIVEKLGFSNIFVSGCPSLYYSGEKCIIPQNKVEKNKFSVALNEKYVSSISNRIYDENPTAIFFDQGNYFTELYEPHNITKFSSHKYPFVKLYEEGRLDGDMNYWLWSKRIKETCNFSYGARIHGNIVALQNGIPAFVKICDSRTRELVEFFNIPNSIDIHFDEEMDSLYDLYYELNYEKFMQTRDKHYIEFLNWLNENNIPHVLGKNDAYKNLIKDMDFYDYRQDEDLFEYKKTLMNKFPRQHV